MRASAVRPDLAGMLKKGLVRRIGPKRLRGRRAISEFLQLPHRYFAEIVPAAALPFDESAEILARIHKHEDRLRFFRRSERDRRLRPALQPCGTVALGPAGDSDRLPLAAPPYIALMIDGLDAIIAAERDLNSLLGAISCDERFVVRREHVERRAESDRHRTGDRQQIAVRRPCRTTQNQQQRQTARGREQNRHCGNAVAGR